MSGLKLDLEKLATVGRFAARVAHEVNNPLAFVLENLQRLQEHTATILPVLEAQLESPTVAARQEAFQEAVAELASIVDESLQGAQRVSGIVRQLHAFSSVGDQQAERVDLREVVDSAILMLQDRPPERDPGDPRGRRGSQLYPGPAPTRR